MNTKVKIIFLSILCFPLFFGCNDDDFLDRKPIDFLAPDNFNTEKDIREAVNGIYKAYISDKYEPIMTEFFTDNGFYVGYIDLWNRNFTSETSFVETRWSMNYKIILRANTVLHYIDNVVDLTEDQYNQYKGEALFLRALAYFNLSEFYGGVPLRTKPESLSEADKPITPLTEIVNFVLQDLETASELLPVTYDASEKGRATKGAAWAMKARVLLYNKYYAEAIEYCRKVKALGLYSINNDYPSMFVTAGEDTNTETIFDMQFEQNQKAFGLSNSWKTVFVNWGGYQVLKNLEEEYYSINGLSIFDPDNSLYDTTINPAIFNIDSIRNGALDNRFTNRDPRMNFSIVVPYSIYTIGSNGLPTPYRPSDQKNSNLTGFKVRKYVDLSDGNVNDISGVNPIIIRYADILLMEAEALVELGEYDEAYVANLINQVRQRPDVMMPKVEDVEGTGLTQDEMRQIIRHERRVEFAFEGLRIFDIKRWDIGAEAYSDGRGYVTSLLTWSSAEYVEHVYQTRTFDPAKGYLWPIPKSEVDSNDAIEVESNDVE